MGAELLHADRRTDGHDEANSRVSQFCGQLLPPLMGKWGVLLQLIGPLYTEQTVLLSLIAYRFISSCVCVYALLVL
jgi:hypothetical protein